MKTLKIFFISFRYAFSGLWFCVRSCRNFRFHIIAAAYVLYFSRFFALSRAELAVLLLLMSLVLTAEAVNSAIEQTCNAVTTDITLPIKRAKDAAAAAVLVLAIFAVVIAVLFFGSADGFLRAFSFITASLLRIVIFIASAVASVIFVFCERIFWNGK